MGWHEIPASRLVGRRGCIIAFSEEQQAAIANRLMYAVTEGTHIRGATRDGFFTIKPDETIWIKEE